MKKLYFLLFAIIILASCKTSRDYLLRSNEDKTLFDIVKRLNKQPADEPARQALPIVYKEVTQRHLKTIASLSVKTELNRWDKIAAEYAILQNIFTSIEGSGAAIKLVTPRNYLEDINATKLAAAEDFYQQGIDLLATSGRAYAKKAYASFKKADTWVNGYKDSKAKMEEAFNNSIVIVIINPVQDNSFFFNTGWGNAGYNFSNDYFQQNLVRDLGGKYASRYPAQFYTDWEARRDDVQPNWVVDLTLRDMEMPAPAVYNYSRNLSKQVENGKDSSGHTLYTTVNATLHIQKQSFTARARMDVSITDVLTRKSVAFNSYTDNYDWREEVASYSGDSRALSSNDWALVNNKNYSAPRREDVLNELYRRIYPQVKNKISYAVDW